MSVPRGFGLNGQALYSNICKPCDINMSFVVDSANANGLGLSSLKSNGYIESVFMNSLVAPAGSPAMGQSRSYGILGASAVTSTGNTVITGNLGIYPGTSVTGFPPGTFSGVLNVANAASQSAKASAQVAYTDLAGRASSVIATDLGGQSLTAGVYSSAGGTFTLASAGAATLTLTGSATDIFVFKMATTLTTGAGGIPTITLAGGALAKNVYWAVGSSATINSGFSGVFQGNIIAVTSITDTLGGTVNGSLIALNGAVTLSAATIINVQSLGIPAAATAAGSPNPLPGYAMIKFKNNFNKYLNSLMSIVAPLSGSNIAINGTSLVLGQPYVISSLGTSTAADWLAVGLPAGFTAAVGQSFIAIATGDGAGSGTGQVQVPLVSAINSMEIVGDPSLHISNSNISANAGAYMIVQFLSNEVLSAPVDGSIVSIKAQMDGSSVTIDGL